MADAPRCRSDGGDTCEHVVNLEAEIERLRDLIRRIDKVTIWDGVPGAVGLQEEIEAVLGIGASDNRDTGGGDAG